MAEIFKGKKYSLTDYQIRGLANICYREQGSGEAGVRACATHMLNYYEKYQTKKYSNPFDCTVKSGWYGTESFNQPYINGNSAPQSVIGYVRDVIINGNRSLPSWVDEYDCLSDVKTASNNGVSFNPNNRSMYKKDVTKVTNVYGSTWTFYCFPDGANGYTDAFGYISKPANAAEKPVINSGNTTQSAASTASIIESAVSWAEGTAADDTHGYSQENRWGPDYDCSSMIIDAYRKAGVPIDINKVYYTGNMQDLTKYGFTDVTNTVDFDTAIGMRRGDILYYHISGTNGHTAMVVGNGKIVHARGQSYGSPASGDQGTEIAVTKYSRSKWQHVLRYTGGKTVTVSPANTTTTNVFHPEYQYGDISAGVKEVQGLMNKIGYSLEEDGEFGEKTYVAVTDFQKKYDLEVDGVVGKHTLAKIKEIANKQSAAKTTATPASTTKTNTNTTQTTTATKTSTVTKTTATTSTVNKQNKDGSYKVTKTVKYQARAIDDNLNVRMGPGFSYGNITSYPRLMNNIIFEVCDTVRSLDGSDWLYICINHNIYGFVSANYVKRVQ